MIARFPFHKSLFILKSSEEEETDRSVFVLQEKEEVSCVRDCESAFLYHKSEMKLTSKCLQIRLAVWRARLTFGPKIRHIFWQRIFVIDDGCCTVSNRCQSILWKLYQFFKKNPIENFSFFLVEKVYIFFKLISVFLKNQVFVDKIHLFY